MRYLDDPVSSRRASSADTVLSGRIALGAWTRRLILATGLWALVELPFELWISLSARDALACIVGKLLWLALVGFVLTGSRVARIVYALLCTIGLMAMSFGLPVEFRVSPLLFLLSSVECVLKASAFVCLVSADARPYED
ncbi:hypothetical protein [Caballeronia sp. TF1N1]|uniref:hypothetical protein n=1 Tax=Caballeronia sp. TF1N1 TaxID=2878153 RepID=UPI001FD12D2D|nr:hypothetical protein [Caballeronia sp. TF1N1]